MPVAEPREELHRLLRLYRQGLREPLHFFPETSRAWAEAKEEQRDRKAAASWYGGYMRGAESEDTAYQIALRGREPLDEHFRDLSATVFGPLLACREK
jgi:exodeoxyribonuclease V gamma subunit